MKKYKQIVLLAVLCSFDLWALTADALASEIGASEVASSKALKSQQSFDHSQFDQLLREVVLVQKNNATTRVNYSALKKQRQVLKVYLQSLSRITQTRFDNWTSDHQLAFLINAYNAQTLDLVLSKYPDLNSIKDLGSLFQSPWSKELLMLLGEKRSLDDIEHTLIRGDQHFKRYNYDPRIHFAVNCASLSCPGLYEMAFDGDQLQQQLKLVTERFLRSDNIVFSAKSAKVSKIFDWYQDDFTKGWRQINSLNSFFLLYKDVLKLTDSQIKLLSNGQYKIQFQYYDWGLNDV